jgi:hypothetical protein
VQKTFLRGQIYFNDRRATIDCVIREISDHGARLELHHTEAVPDTFELNIPQKKQQYVAEIKWRRGHEAGVEFRQAEGSAHDDSLAGMLTRLKKLEAEVAHLRRLTIERKLLPDNGL